MDKLLEIFALDLRTRNKLRNIILHLRKHGKTVDDYIEYVNALEAKDREQLAEHEKVQKKHEVSLLPCPECGAPMIPRAVNTEPGNQTGDDSASVHICINRACMNQIFE